MPLKRNRYIVFFAAAVMLMAVTVVVYLNQLSQTVADNLMASVDEISSHDVESIEGSLDNSYARLGSVAERMDVYDVHTVEQAQEQLNLEAASSAMFNAIYLMDEDGTLYSSSYVRLDAGEHAYDEIFADGREHFVMLYDDANGRLETTKESLIYGIRLDDLEIAGRRFTAMLGRSDLSTISDKLLIESFGGQGVSSVVNAQGYYIVSASPATDLAGRNNFYDMLEAGRLENGVTIEDVRTNLSAGKSFVINCTTADGERLVLSFAPVEGTSWSFIMAVPSRVFEQRFAPFMTMTAVMLVIMVVVFALMLLLIYRFMKRTLSANAEAAARSEFLSNMSHEIRTPLNGIIGLNYLMERNLDDREAMAGYVGKLGKAAQYLLSLVNDILDVSKLQAGKVVLLNAPLNLKSAVNNVCEMQREPMAEKKLVFDIDTAGLTVPELMGDEARISQVLMNILSNAVKFTPEGGTVSLKVDQVPLPSGNLVTTTFIISDTGCGMTPDFRDHIFEAFTQERTSNDNSQKGTGLGMSICALLVAQMGGSISVESELGRGSVFTVIITLARQSALTQGSGAAPDGSGGTEGASGSRGVEGTARPRSLEEGPNVLPALEKRPESEGAGFGKAASGGKAGRDRAPMRLLVAEDNELNAETIQSILEAEGYEVVLAADGQQAVDRFGESAPYEFSAILMDAQMPVMDGFEAARQIRELSRDDAGKVRIYACTASTFAEDRERALASGMDDFLPKPLNVRIMLGKLESLRGELS